MVKLKNKPKDCTDCPFCYVTDHFSYGEREILRSQKRYCGVMRDCANMQICPLDKE